jgi:hypothetical protein
MLAIAVNTDCASGGKGNEKAVAPLRAMHEELRSSATTSAQRRAARDWLLYIDTAEYGHDEGLKKKQARDGDWFSRCLRITRSDPMTGKTTQIIVERMSTDRIAIDRTSDIGADTGFAIRCPRRTWRAAMRFQTA